MRNATAALDHLVLATPDLDATTRWVGETTGVQPSAGGQHIGLGTRNMLCSFSPTSYLEIVGPDPAQGAITAPRPFGVDDLTEPAVVAWAVRVADMQSTLGTARATGFDPGDAVEMQRRRPDGVTLSWQLTPVAAPTIPFLIDWGASPHPAASASAGLELVELRARHPEPATFTKLLGALEISMAVERGDEALVVEIHGPRGSLQFGAG